MSGKQLSARWAALAIVLAGAATEAKNIDLSTVPDRETVQLTIYNSEDLTLVRETRKVSFKPGENPLQFSWANTLIDPTCIDFRITIEGREDIKDKEPKRLVSMKVADVPLEVIYKLTDRDGGGQFTKYYRFKNQKLLDDNGEEKELPSMENLGVSPLPDGTLRLFSEYETKDLAYVGGTETKYVPIGDRVKVSVGLEPSITMKRRLNDQYIRNVVARQYRRRPLVSRTHQDQRHPRRRRSSGGNRRTLVLRGNEQ